MTVFERLIRSIICATIDATTDPPSPWALGLHRAMFWPLCPTLSTHMTVYSHTTTSIVKFADDTVVQGLISNNNQDAYRDEVEKLTAWCQANCLSLNISKTKDVVIERQQRANSPLMIDGSTVVRVNIFKYLGIHISEDLTCAVHTQTQIKKPDSGCSFWDNCGSSGSFQQFWKFSLGKVAHLAERITGAVLPSLQDIYTRRCTKRAIKIIKDTLHLNCSTCCHQAKGFIVWGPKPRGLEKVSSLLIQTCLSHSSGRIKVVLIHLNITACTVTVRSERGIN